VLLSHAVEALRRSPTPPGNLPWAQGVSIEYAALAGIKVRYIKSGSGPNLLLLHTLRTQFDIKRERSES
jgi:hypothetical protein